MIGDVVTLGPLLLMSVVVFGAAMVQAALGMGYGMVAAPLLALINPVFVPVPTIIIGMLTSSAGAWSERRSIIWAEVRAATVGRVSGIVVACLAIYAAIDERHFILVFGLLTAAAVAISASGWRMVLSGRSLFKMGVLSGLMGTITGVGAPPLAIVYSARRAESARPTLAAIFALGCGLSIVGLSMLGWVGGLQLTIVMSMLPAMLFGTLLGRRFKGIAADQYRPALLWIAGISAALLIIKGLMLSL